MPSHATIITIWDYIPALTLCLLVAALYLTSVTATFSKAQWPKSRAYRIFLFALAPILGILMVAEFDIGISNYNCYRRFKAGDEAQRLVTAVFTYFQMHENRFPEGNNSEILKALTGSDETSTLLSKKTFLRINRTGEAIDPWGLPIISA